MVYRHSLIARITHLTFFVSFLVLALTGTQMFLHRHWLHLNVAHIHEYVGLAMLASGIVYVGNGLLSGELGKLLYTPADNAGMWPMIAYYLRLRKAPPQYDDYNSLQKLSYTMVLLLIGPLIAATGIAMWSKTGGRAMGLLHLGFALELVLFFFGHTIMVATTGLWNNVHSMITGWYRRPAPQAAVTPERAPTTAQSREASLTRA